MPSRKSSSTSRDARHAGTPRVSAPVSLSAAQARRVARLESLARTDGLTGLHNFRALQLRLDEEFARAGAPPMLPSAIAVASASSARRSSNATSLTSPLMRSSGM